MGQQLHASAFAYQGAGCLLLGESGTGKSTLVSRAILRGAELIGDDHIYLEAKEGKLYASPAPNLKGVLEVRGLGLIQHPHVPGPHPIDLVIELNPAHAAERLPAPHTRILCGIAIHAHILSQLPDIASLLLYLSAVQENRVLPADWFASG